MAQDIQQNGSYSSSLVIEELTQPGSGKHRRLVELTGSALPFMGAEWSGSLQMTTTWYPGNGDEATQQVLGPREMPSNWNGDWRRTMLGRKVGSDSQAVVYDTDGERKIVVDPHILRETLEDIFRSGMRLRVSWIVSGQIGTEGNTQASAFGGVSESFTPTPLDAKIVREGRAKTWKFKHTRMQDIEWNIEFEWVSRGKKAAPKVTNTRSPAVANSTGALEAKIAALRNAGALTSLKGFVSTTIGQLKALANAPSKLVNDLSRKLLKVENDVAAVGDLAKTIASQPTQIANIAINHAHNAVSLTNKFGADMGRIPAELLTLNHKARDVVRAYKNFHNAVDNAADVAREATTLMRNLQLQKYATAGAGQGVLSTRLSTTQQSTQQVYVTKDGDTPMRVSQKFYQSPDHGADICRANRLTPFLPVFPKGRILVIPVLPSASVGV